MDKCMRVLLFNILLNEICVHNAGPRPYYRLETSFEKILVHFYFTFLQQFYISGKMHLIWAAGSCCTDLQCVLVPIYAVLIWTQINVLQLVGYLLPCCRVALSSQEAEVLQKRAINPGERCEQKNCLCDVSQQNV